MFTAHTLHQQAQEFREQAQSVEALALYEKALVEYISEQDAEGIIRVLLEKVITYRHLFFFTKQYIYIELAATTLQMAEHMANLNKELLDSELHATVIFHIAQITEAMGESEEAVQVYEEALEYLPKEMTANKANILSHLALSEWHSGKKEDAMKHFSEAHNYLETNSETQDAQTNIIWLSGSHLLQAEAVCETNVKEALQHIKVVKKLLNSEEEYPIRWKQMREIEERIEKDTA